MGSLTVALRMGQLVAERLEAVARWAAVGTAPESQVALAAHSLLAEVPDIAERARSGRAGTKE